jgi:hypothetical protein
MNRTTLSFTLALTLSAPALGQTIYKCPSPTPGAPPILQQVPCPTGSGEEIKINAPKPGSDGGLRESEKTYAQSRDEFWQQKADADEAERQRTQALNIERDKVRAAEEQAAAQRATAAAIRATAYRRW